MSAPIVRVDFIGQRARVTLVGGLLLAVGLAAAAAAALEFRQIEARRAGLELKLEGVTRRGRHDPAEDARNAALGEQAGRVALELGAPWTRLLAELEAASRDSNGQVAVLSIEPDAAKHQVRISGESADLPLALAYVQRLQASPLMRYPMLDSHEVRSDDPQHPVRFALTAEWRALP
jgi:hypothetical protein